MAYHQQLPAKPLRAAVSMLWQYDGYRPRHSFESVLPSGTVELVVNLREAALQIAHGENSGSRSQFLGPLISGVQARPTVISTRQQEFMIGAHFRPAGMWQLFGVPADEVFNRHVTLDAFWGKDAFRLWDQLVSCVSVEGRFQILNRALLLRARKKELHPATQGTLQEFQDPTGETTGVNCRGLSRRRFIELFRRDVGCPPKLFTRILRFQKSLTQLQGRSQISRAEFAVEHGYYDQAHWIRDFREFTGLTPTRYEKIRAELLRDVPREERGQICPIHLAYNGEQ